MWRKRALSELLVLGHAQGGTGGRGNTTGDNPVNTLCSGEFQRFVREVGLRGVREASRQLSDTR